jgi:hypothetical protein
MVAAVTVAAIVELQAMQLEMGMLLTLVLLKGVRSRMRKRRAPPARVPVDRCGVFQFYYDKPADVFLNDVGLTHRAFDEVLARVSDRITRAQPLKGHGGSLEPGIKLMIALRWLRGSRLSDFKDIFKCGRYARSHAYSGRVRARGEPDPIFGCRGPNARRRGCGERAARWGQRGPRPVRLPLHAVRARPFHARLGHTGTSHELAQR